MSKPHQLALLYKCSQEVAKDDREGDWEDEHREERQKKEQDGKKRTMELVISFAASVYDFPQKEEIKEVVLNDFYSFASASLLFISLLFSLSPTAGRFSLWFSEVAFLEPLSAMLCLSLDFFAGLLPCPAAVAPDFLGLERGTLYLST